MAKVIVMDADGHIEGIYDEDVVKPKKRNKVVDFVEDHKESIAFWTPILIPVFSGIFKTVKHEYKMSQERQLRTRYIYDNRTRRYYKLKRDITNREKLEIERREKAGEPLGHILESMRVLK